MRQDAVHLHVSQVSHQTWSATRRSGARLTSSSHGDAGSKAGGRRGREAPHVAGGQLSLRRRGNSYPAGRAQAVSRAHRSLVRPTGVDRDLRARACHPLEPNPVEGAGRHTGRGPGRRPRRMGADGEGGPRMAAERRARAVWEGTLLEGRGRLSTESTPVLSDQPVTWASRTEDPGGRTSPEELLAAAHAACYAMALSAALARRETPASGWRSRPRAHSTRSARAGA